MTGEPDPLTANSLERFRQTYFEECAELLESVYTHLSGLENNEADNETVNAVFRAVHSIKGGGGAFGLSRLVSFTHVLETLLDMMRDGRAILGPDLLPLTLRATDMVADLVAAARSGNEPPPGTEDELRQALSDVAANGTAPAAAAGRPTPTAPAKTAQALNPVQDAIQHWRIHFTPHASLYSSANEPLLIFRDLARLGPLTVQPDVSRIPDLASFDPSEAYIAWRLDLDAAVTAERVADAFEFVTEDCDLLIEAVAAISPKTPANGPLEADAEHAPDLLNGDIPQSETLAIAATSQRADAQRGGHSIRIDVEKVDRLVNLVGELVINQAMLVQIGAGVPQDLCPGLTSGLETLSQHLRELQEGVMAIRAQPVRSVFSRMPRLVREVAGQLGKSVRLVVSGEGTEIDKTVIEQLADPLTHLLRNALDHGIETPAARQAADKPPQGTIHLSAEHRSGRIVIEVADDGHGIDRDKVLAKARQRGLVAADATLDASEIDQLIFMPGFSTADAVSSISGRGVGMDVVRRNIQALGGRIAVASTLGQGSLFTLSLPLTLAILDGMAVAVGQETYIIPLTNIMESLRPQQKDLHPVVGCGDVLAIRGEYVPLVYLHQVFDVAYAEPDACRGIVVIVESESAGRFGIVVDEMLGQQQVVVKSLEANYGAVDGIGGATILGNGRVALILDAARLQAVAGANMSRRTTLRAASDLQALHTANAA